MLQEIDEYEKNKNKGGRPIPDYLKTSLAGPMDVFEKFLKGAIADDVQWAAKAKVKKETTHGDAMDIEDL